MTEFHQRRLLGSAANETSQDPAPGAKGRFALAVSAVPGDAMQELAVGPGSWVPVQRWKRVRCERAFSGLVEGDLPRHGATPVQEADLQFTRRVDRKTLGQATHDPPGCITQDRTGHAFDGMVEEPVAERAIHPNDVDQQRDVSTGAEDTAPLHVARKARPVGPERGDVACRHRRALPDVERDRVRRYFGHGQQHGQEDGLNRPHAIKPSSE